MFTQHSAILAVTVIIASCMKISECGCVRENEKETEPVCPPQCKCMNVNISSEYLDEQFEVYQVNCTSRDLVEVPGRLPSNTTELLLGDNNIRNLSAGCLDGCHQLTVLNISSNLLTVETVANNSFESNKLLQKIDMSDNDLVVSRMSESLFSGLERLRILHIYKNDFYYEKAYNHQLFSRLVELRELAMDGVEDGKAFDEAFSRLVNLQFLRVHAGLTTVSNGTFESFANSSVKKLALVENLRLTGMEPMAFAHFRHLEYLEISENKRLHIENISMSWWGLQFTNISTLNVSRTDCVSPHMINEKILNYLNLTELKSLTMVKNNAVYLQEALSTNLPHLTYLDLSDNRLGFKTNIGQLLTDIWQMKKLKYFYVSYQLSKSAFFTSGSASELHLPNEEFDLLNPSAVVFRALIDHRSGNKWYVPLPPSLEELKINKLFDRFVSDIPMIVVFGGSNLQLLESRMNNMKKITGPVIFTQKTKDLKIDLSDNHITFISPNVFRESGRLGSDIRELKLANNYLVNQIMNDTTGEMFRWFRGLKRLNLARNHISTFPKHFFQHLKSLKVLELASNKLYSIEFDIKPMNGLQVLGLGNNRFKTVDEATTRMLTELMRSDTKGLRVDFKRNPIGCSCGDLRLLHWLSDNKRNLLNFAIYTCVFNAVAESITHIDLINIENMEYTCSQRLTLILTSSAFMLVILLIAISACCYRYRWEVRYSCLKLTQRSKKYQLLVEMERNFDYDAFVAYDHADAKWVNEQLLPNLEGHPMDDDSQTQSSSHPIRLCIHERDFIPGEDIVGNIWNKMESSRKIILVLSKTFNASNYCNYEVQLARMNSVEQARNLIIPVLLEPVDIKEMSECLRWIVRKLTYIEWPQHDRDKEEFWQKLRDAVAAYDMEFFQVRSRSD